jgi:Transposase DDE domain
MSSVSILRASKNIVKNQVLPKVPKVWSKQVAFGMTALALKPLVSCNANARMTGVARGTAESKMSRLLANTKLPKTMARIVASLGLVTEYSYIDVDHSDFNGLVALVFAVQTRIGRALPIFLETSYSGKLSSRDDAPKRTRKLRVAYKTLIGNETGRTIASLKTLKATLGFWPKLVFDRGFGSQDIIRYLYKQRATFYIRVKADRLVGIAGEQLRLKDAKRADELVTIAGLRLRVLRSPRNGRDDEPWYILTNDLRSSRNKIVKIYYHRFEIEETFRDIKTNVGLRRTKLMKPNSLAILLWFVSLGILILYLAGLGVLGIRGLLQRLNQPPAKKRLSWYRILMELREQEILRLSYGTLTGVR